MVASAGEAHAYDQAIVSCSRSSTIQGILHDKAVSKRIHYELCFNRIGYSFHPIVFTALGGTDGEFEHFISKYKKISVDNNKKISMQWFFTRLSVVLAYYLGIYVARSYHGVSI